MMNENLANRITSFFVDYNMLGGATEKEMYDATLRALNNQDKEDILIIISYFRDIYWTNKRAKEIYTALMLRI